MKKEAYRELQECLSEMNGKEYDPLPHDIVVELVAKAKEGDISAKQTIINAFTKSFKSYVINWSYINPRITIQELFQVVRYGILEASVRYDPDRKSQFRTYAHFRVKRQYMKYRNLISRIETGKFAGQTRYGSIDFKHNENRLDFECEFDRMEAPREEYREDPKILRLSIDKLSSRMSKREKHIINSYYGIGVPERRFPTELANSLSMDRSSINRILDMAKQKIKRSAEINKINVMDLIG